MAIATANIIITTKAETGLQLTIQVNGDREAPEIQRSIDTYTKIVNELGHYEICVSKCKFIPMNIAATFNPDTWIKYMAAYDEHGDAFMYFVKDVCSGVDLNNVEYCVCQFEECYAGEYDSEEDFVIQYLDETGELSVLPPHISCYFDYEAYASDFFINCAYSVNNRRGGIYVYWRV